MYFQHDEVHQLVATMAERLPGGALVFDALPRWLSERSRSGKLGAPGGWQPPPWTWWIDGGERRALREIPNVAELRRLHLPRGRGAMFGVVAPALGRFPGLGTAFHSILLTRFGPGAAAAVTRPATP